MTRGSLQRGVDWRRRQNSWIMKALTPTPLSHV